MTERDYVSHRALKEDVVVVGNTRVYKALKNQFEEILEELKRIGSHDKPDEELLKVLNYALKIYEGLRDESKKHK